MHEHSASQVTEIERIVRQRETALHKPVIVDAEPDGVYFLPSPNGALVRFQAEAPPIKLSFHSVADLIKYAEENKGNHLVQGFYNKEAIWLNMNEIGTEEPRRHFHTMELAEHTMFSQLKGFGRKIITQKELVKLLQTEFPTAVADEVIETFRLIRYRNIDEGESGVQHANASIPSSIIFSIPIYDLPEVFRQTYTIKVLVDVDTCDKEAPIFKLTPVQTDITEAQHEALLDITKPLREQKSFAVYNATV